jgi:hypothetical protein
MSHLEELRQYIYERWNHFDRQQHRKYASPLTTYAAERLASELGALLDKIDCVQMKIQAASEAVDRSQEP